MIDKVGKNGNYCFHTVEFYWPIHTQLICWQQTTPINFVSICLSTKILSSPPKFYVTNKTVHGKIGKSSRVPFTNFLLANCFKISPFAKFYPTKNFPYTVVSTIATFKIQVHYFWHCGDPKGIGKKSILPKLTTQLQVIPP